METKSEMFVYPRPGIDIYYPTYQIRADLDEPTELMLLREQGDGPLAIIDVTEICASCKVSAELRNGAGVIVGRVDANGVVQLVDE